MLRDEDLPNNPVELIEIYRQAVDQYDKLECEESLYEFVKAAWPIVEPGCQFMENWHIKTICAYVEAFFRNELPEKRLIINIPPGTLKSLIISCFAPAWRWCIDPAERFLTISCEQGLAVRDARRMKQIITSDWYQSKWPIKLAADQNEKTLFSNDKHGFRQAQGITASNTGKRGSCFPAYMEVWTDKGFKPIVNIVRDELVYSMNTLTGEIELKPVMETFHNGANDIIELALSNGEVIHCTPNHKFWTVEEGYIEARHLSVSLSHCPFNIIGMISVNSEHLAQLFTRHGGITDKNFVSFREFIFTENTMPSAERRNDCDMAIKQISQFSSRFSHIQNNIFICFSNFNNFIGKTRFSTHSINGLNSYIKFISNVNSWSRHIKNIFNFGFREFSLVNPRIHKPFFDSVLSPVATCFNSSDRAWIKPIFFSDNSVMSGIETYSFSNFRCDFSAGPVDANWKSPMPFSIVDIFRSSTPCKIINSIVKCIAIKVPNFMFWCWLRPVEGKTNADVNKEKRWLPIAMPRRFKITNPIISNFKKFGFSKMASAKLVVIDKPGFASNQASIANRIHTLITGNGSPQNIVSVRRIGHIDKTYCLNVKDNNNLFIGKKITLASNCLIIDDAIDTKHAFSDVINQSVLDTYDQSLSTRLNDPITSGVLIIMQRARYEDLTGHLIKKSKQHWTHLVIPMRYEGTPTFNAEKDIGNKKFNDPRLTKGELMFPDRFNEKSVQGLEEDLGEFGTASQLQQRPSPLGGGILRKHWFRIWPDDVPMPICTHIFLSLDTAFSEADSKTSAFSACTRWGIFWHEQRQRYCIMALGMWFQRCGYDELRDIVKQMVKDHNPDIVLVEKKATGISLLQDLRRAIPGRTRAYSPGRGEDKISRAHSVSPILESGQVHVPNKVWALGDGKSKLGLVDYLAMFPTGAPPCQDLTDCTTQALIYLRAGHWSGDHPDDVDDYDKPAPELTEEEKEDTVENNTVRYYG